MSEIGVRVAGRQEGLIYAEYFNALSLTICAARIVRLAHLAIVGLQALTTGVILICNRR